MTQRTPRPRKSRVKQFCVYFYAYYDEHDKTAHSGLLVGTMEKARNAVYAHEGARYVRLACVPELVAVYKYGEPNGTPEIMTDSEMREKIENGEITLYGRCPQ